VAVIGQEMRHGESLLEELIEEIVHPHHHHHHHHGISALNSIKAKQF